MQRIKSYKRKAVTRIAHGKFIAVFKIWRDLFYLLKHRILLLVSVINFNRFQTRIILRRGRL